MMHEAVGAAALTIFESLLIALQEKNLLSNQEVNDLLTDAVEAHGAMIEDAPEADTAELHRDAIDVIKRLRDHHDSVRALQDAKIE